jgi:hypothetical protein
MEWEEVEKNLIRLLGPNYFNYPQCLEWNIKRNIKIMKYLEKRKEKSIDRNNID